MSGKEATAPYIVQGRLYVPYFNYYGALASEFYRQLRDSKKIMGVKCPSCDKVYMPPRSVCAVCFGNLNQLVEVSTQGAVLTYTVIHYTYSPSYQPATIPYAYGIIQLDGADTGFCHLLGEVDLDRLSIGMRVEAVFKDQREGNILDIKYFRPVQK
ncbi:MAG TPA: Zn-ribbon domain-containing OB-fold protein [Dehalococcoidia bacterium]|nr:Zn-ribbon domain-containing OB-fold protein [Dehalococcoidia bacterium]